MRKVPKFLPRQIQQAVTTSATSEPFSDISKNTLAEIDSIESAFVRQFPQGSVGRLIRDQAQEAAIRNQAARHRWLHVATHGCFDRELAEASADRSLSDLFDRPANERTERELLDPEALTGLVLAGANRPIDADQDDGRLTDLEISTLDLRNVDLAVLSACDTATGRLSAGDGVLGLQRAFHIAGAKTVVASLWQVDDLSTRELMTEFYHNLWTQHSDKPVSKLHALTDAQRTLLRHYDPKSQTVRRRAKVADSPTDTRVAPYHWAAFILSGDWR